MDDFIGNSRHEEWISGCVYKDTQRTSSVESQLLPYSDDSTEDDEKKVPSPGRYCKGSKPHSTPLTLKWLEENYEIAEGVCIPRSTLYLHYLDFCEVHDTNPVNAASFGKIIRQQFPQITTRRLGTRGQSKYHYYGIGVRETSHYYDIVYSAKSVQMSVESSKQIIKQTQPFSPRSNMGTILPDFPDVNNIRLPHSIPESKIATFLVMYRSHCQRILDTVITAHFEEVDSLLVHFWQSIPGHISCILSNDVVIKLIGVCDSILYKTIAGVIMPSVLQVLPDSLTQVIRKFARHLGDWVKFALTGLPDGLQSLKLDLSRRLSQALKRQLSLNHLAQAAHGVVSSPEIVCQLLTDWLNIDLNSIVKQTLYTMGNYTDRDYGIIVELCTDFEKLLDEQAPLEGYVDWLDRMVDTCVVKASSRRPGSLRHMARQFLLMWSCFGTRVIRDMTLHSAPSFGSFHLIHLMFDDYVLNKIEDLRSAERINEFMRVVTGDTTELSPDPVYDAPPPPPPDGSFVMSTFTPSAWAEQRTAGVNMCNSGVSTGCLGAERSSFGYDGQSDGYSSGDESLDPSPTCFQSGVTSSAGSHIVGRTPQVNTCTSEQDELTCLYGGQQPHQQSTSMPKPVAPPPRHLQSYYVQPSESCAGAKLGKRNHGSCYVPHSADKRSQELINTKHGPYGFQWTNSQHAVQSGPMSGFDAASQNHELASQSYSTPQGTGPFCPPSVPDAFNLSQQPAKSRADPLQSTGAASVQYYQGYCGMPQAMTSSYACHGDLSKRKNTSEDDHDVSDLESRKYFRTNKFYRGDFPGVQL